MYCPQCGQQQISDSLRFCSRCGFPLEGVMQVLATGGLVASYPSGHTSQSARRRGVKQGALLMLLGTILVPLLGVLNSFSDGNFFDILTPMAAIFFFVGGLMRIIYALLFEEAASPHLLMPTYAPPPMPAQFSSIPQAAALPPAPVAQPIGWRSRPQTAEILQPPSITENTTRLLDKDDPANQ